MRPRTRSTHRPDRYSRGRSYPHRHPHELVKLRLGCSHEDVAENILVVAARLEARMIRKGVDLPVDPGSLPSKRRGLAVAAVAVLHRRTHETLRKEVAPQSSKYLSANAFSTYARYAGDG